MASSNIYEIPCDPEEWRWISPTSIMYGEDGEVYVKPTARTWGNHSHYSLDNHGADPCQVRRLDIHDWEVLVAPDVPLAAGVPDSDWIRVFLWEAPRTPRNRMTDGFAQLSAAMENFGATMQTAGAAMSRLKLSDPLTAQPGTRRGSRVYHVNVMDRDTGKMAVLVMSELKYQRLLEIGGKRINQIVCDDMNADIQEDGTEEHLSIMSVLDNF
jgi:hypothetical protein